MGGKNWGHIIFQFLPLPIFTPPPNFYKCPLWGASKSRTVGRVPAANVERPSSCRLGQMYGKIYLYSSENFKGWGGWPVRGLSEVGYVVCHGVPPLPPTPDFFGYVFHGALCSWKPLGWPDFTYFLGVGGYDEGGLSEVTSVVCHGVPPPPHYPGFFLKSTLI